MATTLRFRRMRNTATDPSYAHENDSGLDLYSAEYAMVPAGGSALIKTGIAVELPDGTEGQVRPLSGLALRSQVTVLNAPGTIDAGYRGEIGVILINHGTRPFEVHSRMRIAQLVITSTLRVDVLEVNELTSSDRGSRGFGSSGQ